MVSNGYFKDNPSDQYLSHAPPPPSSNPGYAYSPYEFQSPYITPTHSQNNLHAHPQSQQRLPSPDGRSPDPFADRVPLKQTSKIQTDPSQWNDQNTHYPPSPENQTPTELLPDRERRRRKSKKKKGLFSGRVPWVCYVLTLAQVIVFVYELIKNYMVTGSVIMTQPSFNPMIGPSTYILINSGARFVPCMRTTPNVQDVTTPTFWPCPNTTTADPSSASNRCTLGDLCGFSGFDYAHPNQWYRFIVPIFLHAGVIHIGFNMLLQITMGREMERTIGSLRFTLVYFSSGIFGFVLGGNYAGTAVASTGASGSLFGVMALVLLDLLYTWGERQNPVRELMWIIVNILISFVLGLLPGLDNFSHIGGFLMGLGAGICILHSPNYLRERIGAREPYRNVGSTADIPMMSGANHSSTKIHPTAKAQPADMSSFVKQPVEFFKGRKPLWWAWWLIRAGALIGISIGFIVLLTNFYNYRTQCSWCKYLSCLPINGWCELDNLQLTNTTTNNKRELLRSGSAVASKLWKRGSVY